MPTIVKRSSLYKNHIDLIAARKIKMDLKNAYFTSDLHLFHENIMKYCNRPWKDVSQMNKGLLSLWNKTVPKDADVFILGDLSLLGNDKKDKLGIIVSKLNGHLHLILGNHDRLTANNYTDIGIHSIHYPYLQLSNGWICCHDPSLATACPENSIILSGHVHGLYGPLIKTKQNKTIIDVGVDTWNYKPISFSQIELLITGIKK